MFTKPFVLITTATLALFVYIGVMVPLLPRLIEEQLGGNEIDIGLNLAIFSIAAVLIRPRLGHFAERHGLRHTMIVGALLAAVATAACTLIDSRWGLLPLRALQGIGEASLFVGAATAISDLAPPGRGAEAASYFSVAIFGGLGIGPVISESVIGKDRFDAALWVAAGFALLAAALALLTPKGLRHHDDDGGERGPRFHRAAIAAGLVLALGVGGFVTFTAFMPDYSVTVGLDGSKWVFATYAGVCLLIRVVAATVPDRIGHARAVTIALTLAGSGLGDAVPVAGAGRCLRQHRDHGHRDLVQLSVADGDDGQRRARARAGAGDLDVHDVLRDRHGDGRVAVRSARRSHHEAHRVPRWRRVLRHRAGGAVEGCRAAITYVRGCLISASHRPADRATMAS